MRPSSRRRVLAALVVAAAISGCGSERFSDSAGAPQTERELRSELQRLEEQANEFLDGGPGAFKARVAALKGVPVVVNQWASWCGPCRYEFPFFAELARKYRDRVAFLGVDTKDSTQDAQDFVREHPVPYPHFVDEDGAIARLFGGGRTYPTTGFYSASGKLVYTHQGGYRDAKQLEDDIRRYALRG